MFIIFYFYQKKRKNLGVAHRVAHRVAHGLVHGPRPRFCPHPRRSNQLSHQANWELVN